MWCALNRNRLATFQTWAFRSHLGRHSIRHASNTKNGRGETTLEYINNGWPGTRALCAPPVMTSSAASSLKPARPRSPHFPPHNAPRVWFITRGASPIAVALSRQVLEHGDYVVAGVMPLEFDKREEQSEDFRTFLEDVKAADRWRERLRVVGLDAR